MYNKSRSFHVDGNKIEVFNTFKPFTWNFGETLKINGRIVARSSKLFQSYADLTTRIYFNGAVRDIVARVAPKRWNPFCVGFQLYIDGEFVGGDRKLIIFNRGERERILSDGYGKFLLRRGPIYGLPWSIVMTSITTGLCSYSTLPILCVNLCFGGLMATSHVFKLQQKEFPDGT